MANRDYFSFETVRDHEGQVICYHVTMIGTIEAEGIVHLRTDLGASGDQKMAFGKVTLRNLDKKVSKLLAETDSRCWRHVSDEELDSINIISFTAKDWRADEAYEFEEGDRVLVEGRAYIRKNPNGTKPELSVTATGMFRLGRAGGAKRYNSHSTLIPQQ